MEANYALIRQLQPNALIAISGTDIRWVGNESGVARLQEDIFRGERVQAYHYHVEIIEGNQWRTVTGGQFIGHKQLRCFPAVTAQRVRLVIDQASAPLRPRGVRSPLSGVYSRRQWAPDHRVAGRRCRTRGAETQTS